MVAAPETQTSNMIANNTNKTESSIDGDGKVLISTDCPNLKLVARGKVRDIYEVDEESLLFVATDRLSAFDVVMKNGIPGECENVF